VLVLTQVFNAFLVPQLAHAALTLSIGLGALVNATWLLVGLVRRGSYQPQPGWGACVLQVIAASALLTIFLMWASNAFAWLSLGVGTRMLTLAGVIVGAALLYFGALMAAGMNLRALVRR